MDDKKQQAARLAALWTLEDMTLTSQRFGRLAMELHQQAGGKIDRDSVYRMPELYQAAFDKDPELGAELLMRAVEYCAAIRGFVVNAAVRDRLLLEHGIDCKEFDA